MDRVILHCDCNSFFASVEAALNPIYKTVPMAVCGRTEDRHGIVLAKNELAKKYGIETAETVYSAKKKCPNLAICDAHHDKYLEYSKRVNKIYQEYTDLVEPFGIDESWLDVTASQRVFGSGMEIAESIRKRVKEEIGITVSIGVSFNKVFAKLGSDYKKPDAITEISRENFRDIVFSLPVGDLLFVGRRTAQLFATMGIRTIGNLAATSKDLLKYKLGKAGEMLYNYANGLDESPVEIPVEDNVKSISNGLTFRHDLVSREESKTGIEYLCDEIGRRLREKSMKCTTVAWTIKDVYLRSIQRQRTLRDSTDITREIADAAYGILCDEWAENKPIRMITVSVSGLVDAEQSFVQMNLFDADDSLPREKKRKREEMVDEIRLKFGQSAISTGAIIGSDIGVSTKRKK